MNGKFCSNCGQKVYTEKDKSLKNIFNDVFHFLTHFDSKLIFTLKTIYKSPGQLSADFENGIRQKYYKPIPLFLITIILYLLFPKFQGMNMDMGKHVGNPFFGKQISQQIENKVKNNKITEQKLSEKFKQKSQSISKFSLLLLIPFAAAMIYFLYFNKNLYLFDNVIHSTEINIFFLLSFFIIMPALSIPFTYFLKTGINDNILGPLVIVLFGVYCIFNFHKVFKDSWLISILKGTIFSFIFVFVVIRLYQFIIFEITFAFI